MREPKASRSKLNKGTILRIEDKETVMGVSREMLEKTGFRVLESKTGEESVDIAESFDGDIDLAILNLGMPDIGGEEIYSRIKVARPRLKVIVCSDFGIEGPAQRILTAGAQGFIQKPFNLASLSAKLKQVLESKDDD